MASSEFLWSTFKSLWKIVWPFSDEGSYPDTHYDEQGETPLTSYFKNHGSLLSQYLANSGADVNTPDQFGTPPLVLATEVDNFAAVRYLIDSNTNVDACDRCGNTALNRTCQDYDEVVKTKTVERLVHAGYDVNKADKDGNTSLIWAAKMGDARMCRLLVESGCDVNKPNRFGDAALTEAVCEGYWDVVEVLASTPSIDLDVTTATGNTSLILAAAQDHLAITSILVNAGASLNTTNRFGETALLMAASKGRAQIVTVLTSQPHCDVNRQTNFGHTPVMLAAHKCPLDVVKRLIEVGGDVNMANKAGYTPLMMAARQGRLRIVKALLSAGSVVTVEEESGDTALTLAARGGALVVVEVLVRCGVTEDDIRNGMRAAAESGNVEVVTFLADFL